MAVSVTNKDSVQACGLLLQLQLLMLHMLLMLLLVVNTTSEQRTMYPPRIPGAVNRFQRHANKRHWPEITAKNYNDFSVQICTLIGNSPHSPWKPLETEWKDAVSTGWESLPQINSTYKRANSAQESTQIKRRTVQFPTNVSPSRAERRPF